MKGNFNLGIEISKIVSETASPHKKIRRYGSIPKKQVSPTVSGKNKVYRYRPGVSAFMNGDLDV